jgi:TolC family type I secretion outer membrane protein
MLRGAYPWTSIFVTMLASLSGTIRAQAQSLDQVLAEVYQQNPQILAERAQLEATDEGVAQARGGWRPTISMTVSGGYANTSQSQTGSVFGPSYYTASQNPASYGLQLTQPIFLGGKTTASTAKAKELVAAEVAHLTSIEQTALLAAATDYVDVAAAQETYDMSVRHEADLERDLHRVAVRFKAGELTRTDESQAEAAVAEAVSAETDAQSALQVALDTYERDVGTRPGHLREPEFELAIPLTKLDAAAAAEEDNPDVLTARYNISAARSDVKVVRSQLLPSVTLNANAQRATDPGLQLNRTDAETVELQLSVPLYEAGVVYSQTRAARDTVSAKEHDLDQAARVAQAQSNAAWDQLQAAHANINAYEAQSKADTIALQGVQAEARTGGRTVFDILYAEATLYQAQVGLVRARHDEIVAKLNLAAAVGRLTARTLALPVVYYDPAKHLSAVASKWGG